MAQKKILVTIEVPEEFDDIWDNDPSGVQAFHDCIYETLLLNTQERLIEIHELNKGSEVDILYAEYLETKLKVLKSLKYYPTE